jgi:hypothetical protein
MLLTHSIFHPTIEYDQMSTFQVIRWRGWRMELDCNTNDATARCTAWFDLEYTPFVPIPTITIDLPWGGSPALWAGLIMARLREANP